VFAKTNRTWAAAEIVLIDQLKSSAVGQQVALIAPTDGHSGTLISESSTAIDPAAFIGRIARVSNQSPAGQVKLPPVKGDGYSPLLAHGAFGPGIILPC
jgi:hypothetical protein